MLGIELETSYLSDECSDNWAMSPDTLRAQWGVLIVQPPAQNDPNVGLCCGSICRNVGEKYLLTPWHFRMTTKADHSLQDWEWATHFIHNILKMEYYKLYSDFEIPSKNALKITTVFWYCVISTWSEILLCILVTHCYEICCSICTTLMLHTQHYGQLITQRVWRHVRKPICKHIDFKNASVSECFPHFISIKCRHSKCFPLILIALSRLGPSIHQLDINDEGYLSMKSSVMWHAWWQNAINHVQLEHEACFPQQKAMLLWRLFAIFDAFTSLWAQRKCYHIHL